MIVIPIDQFMSPSLFNLTRTNTDQKAWQTNGTFIYDTSVHVFDGSEKLHSRVVSVV